MAEIKSDSQVIGKPLISDLVANDIDNSLQSSLTVSAFINNSQIIETNKLVYSDADLFCDGDEQLYSQYITGNPASGQNFSANSNYLSLNTDFACHNNAGVNLSVSSSKIKAAEDVEIEEAFKFLKHIGFSDEQALDTITVGITSTVSQIAIANSCDAARLTRRNRCIYTNRET
ncbi:MAG: hypothetical protein JW841_07070 [Deltaproteobacteria bacterium]|nr:hypothetical protein [Deltaproteobacteria bacterium]